MESTKHLQEPAEVEKYATPKEGAAFLGVPVNTFYKMCLSRVIPSYKIGKLRRVKLSEVAAFAESNRVEAVKSR
jgi:excisionase family DNA binding protein